MCPSGILLLLCLVMQLCGETIACIFDTIVAGPEVGAETLEAIEKFVALLADEGGEIQPSV